MLVIAACPNPAYLISLQDPATFWATSLLIYFSLLAFSSLLPLYFSHLFCFTITILVRILPSLPFVVFLSHFRFSSFTPPVCLISLSMLSPQTPPHWLSYHMRCFSYPRVTVQSASLFLIFTFIITSLFSPFRIVGLSMRPTPYAPFVFLFVCLSSYQYTKRRQAMFFFFT